MWDHKMKAVTFSYDDGVTEDERLLELFARYGVKGTFNLNSGLTHDVDGWKERTSGLTIHRLQEPVMRKLYRGHEVASHGLTHADPALCDDAKLAKELDEDIHHLERIFGTKIVGYAYPFGHYSDKVVEALAARGIRYARTVECTKAFGLPEDPLRLKASFHHDDADIFDGIERFLAADGSSRSLLYIWGHSYEFDVHRNWDRMEDILRALSGRAEVFYGTNAQVLLGVDEVVR